MKRAITVVTLAAVWIASAAAAASRLDQTAWSITGTDKIKVPHAKPLKTSVTESDGVILAIDSTSLFLLPLSGASLSGTVADQGKHGFTTTIDQTAVDAVQTRLVNLIVTATGATSVDVTSMTVTAKGRVNKKGTKLKLKTKAVLKGSATIEGVERSGKVTETATYKGIPFSTSDCASVDNLVQNCSFETPDAPAGGFTFAGPGETTITGWTVVASPSGGVDLVRGTFSSVYPVRGGSQSLDLNHSDPGGISQEVPTTEGQPYQLTFHVSGFPAGAADCLASDPKTLTVSAGSASADYEFTPDGSASPPGMQQFVEETLAFTGASGTSTTVTFTSTTPGCAGPVIDEIAVLPAS